MGDLRDYLKAWAMFAGLMAAAGFMYAAFGAFPVWFGVLGGAALGTFFFAIGALCALYERWFGWRRGR